MRRGAHSARVGAAWATLALSCATAGAARAEYLIADLSDHQIAITAAFTGADVLLFGTREGPGDVVVVVRGPAEPLVVRRKERTIGLWLNTDRVTFAEAPGYYALAASRPLAEIATAGLFRYLGVGLDSFDLKPGPAGARADLGSFREALVRAMARQSLYQAEPANVSFIGDRLFRSDFHFPANVPTGIYRADVYLIADGALVSQRTAALQISKTGFEAALFDFARDQPLFYGLVAVLVALMAGYLAGVIFRKG